LSSLCLPNSCAARRSSLYYPYLLAAMDYVLVLASLVSLTLGILWIRQLLGAKSSLPLPPSPKGLPILGNLLDLASDGVHVKCRDWSRQLGILLSSSW
jgi:hypothetical protein